jgi:plasmid stabilization system protein ParE
MPDRSIVLSNEAARNISAIRNWLAERSPEGANRWYIALFGKLNDLSQNAQRFSLAPENGLFDFELRNATFRTRAGKTYRVLFTIKSDEVLILFVRGPGQDSIAP